MNFRDIFGRTMIVIALFMLTRTMLNWWLQPQEATRFTAPTSMIEQKPLNLEINFAEKAGDKIYAIESIATTYGRMNFSTAGGTLTDFTYVRSMDGRLQEFPVLQASAMVDREQTPLLVGLDTQTPYEYKHVSTTENDENFVLTYRACADAGTITKVFTVSKDKAQIDLELTVDPVKEVTTRIIWPSPAFISDEGACPASSVVIDKRNSFSATIDTSLDLQQGYLKPAVFGAQDKYFIMACVGDEQAFMQRAYYKLVDIRLLSFIESAPIDQKTTWNLSFYCGPKDVEAIDAVDMRLEKALNYGMFSFLSKPLVALLKFLNSYLHNFGLAILVITLLLKLVLLPITFSGDRKMKKMQDYAQKMDYLKRKYKDNPEALKQAQMEMLQSGGMPLSGCLLPLVQLPFFFALSGGLNNSIELYKSSFLWIKDLSMPDPYYILPFLVTMLMLFGGIMQAQGGPRNRMAGIAMGLVFGAFTSAWAAGTVLFIAANVGLHWVQTKLQKIVKL